MAGHHDDVRRALRERVARQVQGSGIPRHALDAAVDQVVAALPSTDGPGAPAEPGVEVVATFSAVSSPDLESRVRNALGEEGVSVFGLGSATIGRHTVVTVLTRGAFGLKLDRCAALTAAALSVLPATPMEAP